MTRSSEVGHCDREGAMHPGFRAAPSCFSLPSPFSLLPSLFSSLFSRRPSPLLALLLVCSLSRTAQAQQWADVRTFGPFVCRADFPLSDWEGLLGELDQLQRDLVRSLGVPPAREPIDLYLFRDKRSYDRFLRQRLPGVPYRRALYVNRQGHAAVFAYRSSQFGTDVRHECTHALLHAVLPLVPLWLDEGLAEYFELPADRRAFDNPYLGRLRWSLRLGIVPRLEALEKKEDISEMGRTEYRDSWAWVHFMLHGPNQAQAELTGYLADLHGGGRPDLLSRRLAGRFRNARAQFAAHFKTWHR